MLTATLAAYTIPWQQLGVGSLFVLFLLSCVLLVLVVLVQRPQGGGLAGAFGGSAAGSGQTAFGAKTGDALTVATIVFFVLWLVLAVWLNYAARPSSVVIDPAAAENGAAPAQPQADKPASIPATPVSPPMGSDVPIAPFPIPNETPASSGPAPAGTPAPVLTPVPAPTLTPVPAPVPASNPEPAGSNPVQPPAEPAANPAANPPAPPR